MSKKIKAVFTTVFALALIAGVSHVKSVFAGESAKTTIKNSGEDAKTDVKKAKRSTKRSIRKATGNDSKLKDAGDSIGDAKDDVQNSATKTKNKITD